MNRLVLDDDMVRDVEHLLEPWMRERLGPVQCAADKRRFAPRRLLRIDNPDLILRISDSQFERKSNALVWRGTFAPLANTYRHGYWGARVVIRKCGVVDGIGITVTMYESSEARRAPAAAVARRGFLWWLKLNG